MLHFEGVMTRSPTLKNFKWIILGIVGLAIVGVGGYLAYRHFAASKEAAFACVATSFPYVIMEHKRAELTGLLDNIKIDEESGKEPDLDAVDKAMKGESLPPGKFFLSKEIDTKMLELADSIQNRAPEAPPLNGDDMTSFLAQLEPMFEQQAPVYLKECKHLFSEIIRTCGSFDSNTEDAQTCRDKYDSQVNALLQKHLGPADQLSIEK